MKIDPSVFQAKFPHHCSLEHCKSRCCKGGVWADVDEKEIILRNAELFASHMRPEVRDPACWFGVTAEDPDTLSGMAIETNVHDDYCVFFHPGHGCSLQKAAVDAGLHEWAFKPRFCIMFPLVLEKGVLIVDEHIQDIWCMRQENRTHPVLASVDREVRHLFPEAVASLDAELASDQLSAVSDQPG